MASFLVCFSHAGASINIKTETRKRFELLSSTKRNKKQKKTDMLSEKTNPFYLDARFWLAATSLGALALLALQNYPP